MSFMRRPYAKQRLFYGLMAVWALMLFWLLVTNVRGGHALGAVISVLLASPVLLGALGWTQEKRRLRDLFNPKTQSWAFLYGDTIALTTSVACAAKAWVHMPRGGWMYSGGWTVLSALIGVLAGIAFHLMDAKGYIKAHAGNLLRSLGKWAHDFVAYPVLFGGLVCVGAPLLFASWSVWTYGMVAGVVLWLYFGIKDMRRGLDPFKLHVPWNAREFRRA